MHGHKADTRDALRWMALAVALAASTAACSPVEPDYAPSVCPEGGHWPVYGCASLLATVEGQPEPWPDSWRWSIRAVSARPGTAVLPTMGTNAGPGRVALELRRTMPPLPPVTDTASVWVIATLMEDPRPIQVGVPLPVFAIDSVLHVVEFVRPGVRPEWETILLRPRVVDVAEEDGPAELPLM